MIKNYQIQMVKKDLPCEAIETASVTQPSWEMGRGFESTRCVPMGWVSILGDIKTAMESVVIEFIGGLYGRPEFHFHQGCVMSEEEQL